MTQFTDALRIPKGLTAIIGSGGKTSLLLRLGMELCAHARVILCASTKMFPPSGVPLLLSPDRQQLLSAFSKHTLLCVGDPAEEGKITLNSTPLSMLLHTAAYVLMEADGAKGFPLKAHATHEPVIPLEAAHVINVVGLDGLGQPISMAAHRPARYAALLGADEGHIITPHDAAAVLMAENLGGTIYLNKAEIAERQASARTLANCLRQPVYMGSLLRSRETICLL